VGLPAEFARLISVTNAPGATITMYPVVSTNVLAVGYDPRIRT